MKPTSGKLALAILLCTLLTPAAFAVNAPTNLSATPVSSQVNLAWTDNSADEIGFTFRFDTSSSFANASYVWTGGPNVTSWQHTGRSAATTYYYQVKAEGSSDPLDSAFGNTAAATTAPANLTASAVSSSQINLSWTGNGANASINGYTVAMNTSASFTGASYQFVSGAGAASLAKTGLAGATTYYFAVKTEGTSDAYDSPFTAFSSATTTNTPTAISNHFYGVNAWMPSQIGQHVFGGNLGTQWTNIANSGAKIMRYGGNGVDEWADPLWSSSSDSTLAQYLALVDNMKSRGIEPVLQVPVYGTRYDTTDAADIVRYINITHARGVKYWSIGNEPDLSSGAYAYTTAAQVAGYIKPFASAMKAVDPTIKILGPETTWYNPTIMNGLTTPGGPDDITGKDANGRYYVDILTFHHYNGFDGTQGRQAVIDSLTQTGGFNDNVTALKSRIVNCNSYHGRTGTDALKIAITEANVNYWNTTGDGVSGNGAKSFLGGQWWAEMLGISMKQGIDFVTFWSTIEGSATYGNELGFISGDGTTKRPTYYHFQMLAQNFRGNVANATDNQTLVKAFAAKDTDQTAVIILNQELSTSFNYTVRLNTAPASGVNPLKINVDAGLAMESNGTIAAQSTILLVFDATGVLKKKIEYTVGNATSNAAPTVTLY
jgi:hypothetical protein